MTILVAAVIGKHPYLASDTRMLINDDEISHQSKIVEFPDFLVGYAGDVKAKAALHKLLNKKKQPKVKDFLSCSKFQEEFYLLVPTGEIELLIITKDGLIFHMDRETVVEYDEWACIGSGASYAKSTMQREFPKPKCIVESIKSAMVFSASCGGDIVLKGFSK